MTVTTPVRTSRMSGGKLDHAGAVAQFLAVQQIGLAHARPECVHAAFPLHDLADFQPRPALAASGGAVNEDVKTSFNQLVEFVEPARPEVIRRAAFRDAGSVGVLCFAASSATIAFSVSTLLKMSY